VGRTAQAGRTQEIIRSVTEDARPTEGAPSPPMLDVNFSLSWNYRGQRGTETLFHTAIGNFVSAMRDWSPAFRSMVSEVLEPAVQEQFATAGQGDWAELAPATLARKRGTAILIESGLLEGSFHTGGPDNVSEISRDRLAWG